MHSRPFLQGAAVLSVLATGGAPDRRTSTPGTVQPVRRVRPADPSSPSEATWDRVQQAVYGRLLKVASPLAACRTAPEGGMVNVTAKLCGGQDGLHGLSLRATS
jgi:hypothetical protein